MKKVICTLLLLVLVAATAGAEPDSFQTGPFEVSFDLGLNKSEYDITMDEPFVEETLSGKFLNKYKTNILKNSGEEFAAAQIIVTTFDTPQKASPALMEETLLEMESENPNNYNLNSAQRIIDGQQGVIVSEYSVNLPDIAYNAMYLIRSDPETPLVQIISLFPWNEGTLSLLKTIHVRRV